MISLSNSGGKGNVKTLIEKQNLTSDSLRRLSVVPGKDALWIFGYLVHKCADYIIACLFSFGSLQCFW